jgi:hypothetical protein
VRAAVEEHSYDLWGLESGDAELERFVDAIAYLLGHPSELDRLMPPAPVIVATAVTDMLRRHAQTRTTVCGSTTCNGRIRCCATCSRSSCVR